MWELTSFMAKAVAMLAVNEAKTNRPENIQNKPTTPPTVVVGVLSPDTNVAGVSADHQHANPHDVGRDQQAKQQNTQHFKQLG